MGRSNHFADMNEVYVHTETAHKEQPAICLRHMSGGSNNCRCQPRPRFVEVEGKFIAELKLKISLSKYPTFVITMRMDLETRLPSAERREVSTLCKLTPISK
jgi:hypothetical protein